LFLAGGAGNGLQNAATRILLSVRFRPEVHGRVSATFRGVSNAAVGLGFLMGGIWARDSSTIVILAAGIVALTAAVLGTVKIHTLGQNEGDGCRPAPSAFGEAASRPLAKPPVVGD